MTFREVTDLARQAGFQAICMRASQIGINSDDPRITSARDLLNRSDLSVSMVTGDFDIVYNNARGPNCLRDIEPYLRLARRLSSPLIRVAMKSADDIPWAQRAADAANHFGLRLAHQCHTLSLFETVESIEHTLRSIDRPNFGLIFEPANLELCGQDYGSPTLERLAPWVFNVYLQNQAIRPTGLVELDTWCRGPVRFDIRQIDEPGGIDFQRVLTGLRRIGYDGPVTVHQCAPDDQSPIESARRASDFLRACWENSAE
jgi:sugar phosphate isomerase/epimerase